MPNLLPLHADRLPEGWVESPFSGQWDRAGHTNGSLTSLLTVYRPAARVYTAAYGDADHGCARVMLSRTFRTRDEAIREVEAAYCNARIRR